MAAIQVAKEMRKYLKMDEVKVGAMQIEDLKEIVINEFKDITEDEDESTEVVELRKDKDVRIKKLLVQITQAYKLLAQSF